MKSVNEWILGLFVGVNHMCAVSQLLNHIQRQPPVAVSTELPSLHQRVVMLRKHSCAEILRFQGPKEYVAVAETDSSQHCLKRGGSWL